jgi:hypothetical protein
MVPPSHKDTIVKLLKENRGVFAKNNAEFTVTDTIQMEINTVDTTHII